MADDEEAYMLYHKEQAEKRLTQEKRLSKAAIAERDREERERKEKERKKAAKNFAPASKPKPVSPAPPSVIIPEVPTVDRVEEIKKELVIIYTEYCPDKINKIDKLLSKYVTREEEFLQFVVEKYGVIQQKKSPEPPQSLVPEPIFEPIDASASVIEQDEEETNEDKSVPMLIPRPPNSKDQRVIA
jgi:hypothetical protein